MRTGLLTLLVTFTLGGICPQRQLLRQDSRRCNCCSDSVHIGKAAGLRSSIRKLAAVLNVESVERPGYGQQYKSCTTDTTESAKLSGSDGVSTQAPIAGSYRMHRQVLRFEVPAAFYLQCIGEGGTAVPITINASAVPDAARGESQCRCGGAALGRSGLEKDGNSKYAIP